MNQLSLTHAFDLVSWTMLLYSYETGNGFLEGKVHPPLKLLQASCGASNFETLYYRAERGRGTRKGYSKAVVKEVTTRRANIIRLENSAS